MSYRDGWDSTATDENDDVLDDRCAFEIDEDGDEYCVEHDSYQTEDSTDDDAICLWASQDHAA